MPVQQCAKGGAERQVRGDDMRRGGGRGGGRRWQAGGRKQKRTANVILRMAAGSRRGNGNPRSAHPYLKEKPVVAARYRKGARRNPCEAVKTKRAARKERTAEVIGASSA